MATNELAKTIKDFQFYLEGMKGMMMKKCSPQQKEHLNEILKSLLILLVGFRKGTHMGEMIIDFRKL